MQKARMQNVMRMVGFQRIRIATRFLIAATLCLAVLRPQSVARAATITVTNGTSTVANGDGCSLPEAIINANNGDQSGSTDCAAGTFHIGPPPGGEDTIILNTNVTLTVPYTASSIVGGGQAGTPDIWTDITIQAGTGNTISANNSDFRILIIESSGIVTLDGVTLQNGRLQPADDSSADAYGGAIYMSSNSTLTLQNGSSLINNTAIGSAVTTGSLVAGHAYGGAIYAGDGASVSIGGALLDDNTVQGGGNAGSGNAGNAAGGVIYAGTGASISITGGTLDSNTAQGGANIGTGNGGAAWGGGLYRFNGASLTLDGTPVTSNQALGGTASGGHGGYAEAGGIYIGSSGVGDLIGISFSNNTAQGGDGAVNGGGARAGALSVRNGVTLSAITGFSFTGNVAQGGNSTNSAGGGANAGAAEFTGRDIPTFSINDFDNNQALGGTGTSSRASSAGALIFDADTALFSNNQFTNNSAQSGAASGDTGDTEGGGLVLTGSVDRFSDIIITANTARTGDSANRFSGSVEGGGMYTWSSIEVFRDTIITDNLAQSGDAGRGGGEVYGGGLYTEGDILDFSNVQITGNSAIGGNGGTSDGGWAHGGGMLNYGEISFMEDTDISGNTLTAGDGESGGWAYGGGLWNGYQIPYIENVTITNNSAQAGDGSDGYGGDAWGGGLYNQDTITTLVDSTVSGNALQAGDGSGNGSGGLAYGGGIASEFGAIGSLSASTIANNNVLAGDAVDPDENGGDAYGGGLSVQDNTAVQIYNTTISGNSLQAGVTSGGGSGSNGQAYGGGVYIQRNTTITHVTLLSNSSSDLGDALYSEELTNTLTASLVVSPGGANDCDGLLSDGGSNLGADDGDTSCPVIASVTIGTDIDANLADNGGPTATHALLPSSPAINATGSLCPAVTNIDQRGELRDSACDSGAFELTTSDLSATKTNDVGGLTNPGTPWIWTIAVANSGGPDAAFAAGDVILTDELPPGPTYSNFQVVSQTGIGGTMTCDYDTTVSGTITCFADGGPVTIAGGTGSFTVSIDAIALPGTYDNPTGADTCAVDPNNVYSELNESDNDCSDSVTVDFSSTVTLTANDNSAAENPLDNGQFTVDLGQINVLGSPITVSYSVAGTATAGVDYNLLSGQVVIPDGDQTATIDLVPFDDVALEGDETVILTLTSTDTTGISVDPTPDTVTIIDDEIPTLTVAAAGAGSGTMIEAGTINCASTGGITSGDCTESAPGGTAFSVVATPQLSSSFAGWTGCDSTSTTTIANDTCNITLAADSDSTVTAAFDDSLPPFVIDIRLLNGTVINPGDTVNGSVIFLMVTLSEDVLDFAGLNNIDDVTNTANYTLLLSGVSPIPITMVSYDNNNSAGPFQALVVVNNGAFLPTGNYTFVVSGTTSVTDYGGNSLDGDGNGVGGDDFSIAFDVIAPDPITIINSGAAAQGGGIPGVAAMPDTGFAPGAVASLPTQPTEKAYADQNDLLLIIPKLGVRMPIVGVPNVGGEWDVTWLEQNAGWLAGTAYPTLNGNSVITGHVWDTFNNPGPFYYLRQLEFGDRFTILIEGQAYTYEITDNYLVFAHDLSPLAHEDLDVVTLLTCEGYSYEADAYLYRRAVRAVLVSVD